MAKRFTDTEKYKKPFVRGLKGPYKLLWDYLYHDCDHAGIWIVDFEIAQIYIGPDMPVNREEALNFFNEDEIRIVEIDDGKKWFIKSFVEFQYGELNDANRAHASVIRILKKYELFNSDKGLVSSFKGHIVKGKEQEKVKVKGGIRGESNNLPTQEEFLNYAKEKEPNEYLAKEHNLILKYQAWKEADWKDGNGQPIKNWKSKLLNTLPHIKKITSLNGHDGLALGQKIHDDDYNNPNQQNY